MENRFYSIAINANRYIVKNGNEPTIGNVTEEKENELEKFIDYAKIVIGTLGYKIFEPLINNNFEINNNDNLQTESQFFLNKKSKRSKTIIEATSKQTSEGFVVLKGSHIETIDSNSVPQKIKRLRENAKISDNGILQEDILFSSPSYAASFVIGSSANGRSEWKTADGKSLNDLEKS